MADLTTSAGNVVSGVGLGSGNVGSAPDAGQEGSLEKYGGFQNEYGRFRYSAVEIQTYYTRVRRRRLA